MQEEMHSAHRKRSKKKVHSLTNFCPGSAPLEWEKLLNDWRTGCKMQVSVISRLRQGRGWKSVSSSGETERFPTPEESHTLDMH